MGASQNLHDHPAVQAAAGLTAGFFSTTLLHPVDMLKVRLQAAKAPPTSLSTTAKNIVVHEGGVRALYRGITPNLVGNSASWALYFLWYDMSKGFLEKLRGSGSPLLYSDYMSASAFSSIATSTLTNPIWLVKTRMLTTDRGTSHASTVSRCIQHVYATDGLRGFYRGLTPSLFGTLTFSIQFTIYEKLKAIRGAQHSHQINTFDYLAFSAVSKLLAGAVTYPYQVLRTRMQTYGSIPASTSVRTLIKQVWWNQGLAGFYQGLLRVIPGTCVTFLVYEKSRIVCQRLIE